MGKMPEVEIYLESLDMTASEAWQLFRLIDADGSSGVDIDEFVDGCMRLKGDAKAVDIAQVIYENRWLIQKFNVLVKETGACHSMLRRTLKHIMALEVSSMAHQGTPTMENSKKPEALKVKDIEPSADQETTASDNRTNPICSSHLELRVPSDVPTSASPCHDPDARHSIHSGMSVYTM